MEKCLHEFFEEQALRTPEAVALIVEEQELTYGELNNRANKVAVLLQSKGIGPEAVVAVYMERSIEAIVCILGILKSGGAYLPVDKEIPEDRAIFMIQDSGSDIVMADSSSSKVLNELYGRLEILMTDSIDWSADEVQMRPLCKPDNLAYIIYTSGSTGKPKGVMIEHRSISNTIAWRKEYYKFNESDYILQFASLSFDSSVEDLFTGLASGAVLVLLRQRMRNDLRYIRSILISRRISHLLVVPSLYRVLLDECPDAVQSLKKVTVAGEGFSRSLVKKHYQVVPQADLFNEYGPTENSVCTSVYKFSGPDNEVKIGLPIPNVEVHIVTASMEPCPAGSEGELLVSGAGLARGYLHQPELTEEKFFRHPAYPGKRLYRTGDLVNVDIDGQLVYLGRIDRQVKLRGHRVELGEIEYQLTQVGGVYDAVATLVHIREKPSLCAYYVSDGMTDEESILSHLSSTLPDYMVPAFVVRIDRVPLTFNGKTDFAALPNPLQAAADDKKLRLEADSQPIANQIIRILNEIQDQGDGYTKQTIIRGALTELGLDSLDFMRLLVRVETEFGLEIESAEWEKLKSSTVEQFSEYVAAHILRKENL
ncbi:non-ribosomal peptide synthetase [Paenibacillus jilunlii]|uniref:Fengycin family lipopeptide synthetase D/bacitracin synthase 3/tyrocidine synthetase-3 n=1 Tax=Paenibacillus jilunlii TaxID=682956 RepID=A0A1G9M641_9BACL|nr:amino acid adenylation domain-containing protein [Paenibacillus jilunlii]SDL69699.1 fengycin family lipopeptide synthetase D/bacitracin synthase 3/tyrocidine synthetase-3 [Paenibacillus jilunlii]